MTPQPTLNVQEDLGNWSFKRWHSVLYITAIRLRAIRMCKGAMFSSVGLTIQVPKTDQGGPGIFMANCRIRHRDNASNASLMQYL